MNRYDIQMVTSVGLFVESEFNYMAFQEYCAFLSHVWP